MKILIVGGGGFVGSWLTKLLISKKNEVVVVDPSIYFSTWDEKTIKKIKNFKKESLLKGAKIYHRRFEDGGDEIIKKEKPDVVVHLAGIPLEKPTEYEFSLKQLAQDIALTYMVVKAVKDNPVKKFIFMSSISAYGDCEDIIMETETLEPRTPYGVTKAAGEFIVKFELKNWNIVRSTNIYGFGDMNGRGSNIILNKILKGDEIWVNSDIVMDFIYVKDLVSGIAAIINKAPSKEVYHISGGHAHKLLEYVKLLKKYYDFPYVVKEVHDRPKRGTMDNSKAKKYLGWKPSTTLSTGIADYMKYVKKYKIA